MSTINMSNSLRNARNVAINTALGASATIKIYTGTIPASPDTAVSTQTLLATFTANATNFMSSTAGVGTLNALTDSNNQVNAVATGTAAWARISTSGGTAHIDVDVGTSAASLILNTTSITSGGPIQLATSGTITESA